MENTGMSNLLHRRVVKYVKTGELLMQRTRKGPIERLPILEIGGANAN